MEKIRETIGTEPSLFSKKSDVGNTGRDGPGNVFQDWIISSIGIEFPSNSFGDRQLTGAHRGVPVRRIGRKIGFFFQIIINLERRSNTAVPVQSTSS